MHIYIYTYTCIYMYIYILCCNEQEESLYIYIYIYIIKKLFHYIYLNRQLLKNQLIKGPNKQETDTFR